MTAPHVAVLDYGSGNLHSVVRAVERAGGRVSLTADHAVIAGADGLVVPGVGAFASVMGGLDAVGGGPLVRDRHAAGLPTLGICVGLQVLFSAGSEHGERTRGIGLWAGEVSRLDAPIVPHMGWSRVRAPEGSRMFEGIRDQHFYFVHSYAAPRGPEQALTTASDHGAPFVAAVEDGATWATQFHPEKSGDAGRALLENWLRTLKTRSHTHSNSEEQQ
ncbi:imidazole glycerol phosphate synthase subunit HisH [Brevibacterium jeotgali]|uniref:Imidazole glycerol phosphate synthase subunit HisH n=1 Tax=Brevibacterium jeotgali TaxID=1262550 RepID=A0A2H1L3I3_9MICO|nr:imidazole glycerol phosphate synthase subunit HisH [Brevibacterium jeotgali]TWC02558.1 imidazole glycerol phosphate synthase subunit HisH [Brevibacterium jeotgali]SMY11350.1 imidazole glycerol phosphate synthase subunit hisH [Brevibacterium jeotgali]